MIHGVVRRRPQADARPRWLDPPDNGIAEARSLRDVLRMLREHADELKIGRTHGLRHGQGAGRARRRRRPGPDRAGRAGERDPDGPGRHGGDLLRRMPARDRREGRGHERRVRRTTSSSTRSCRHNEGRKKSLVRLKLARMAAGVFAFFRGSNELFAREWPSLAPLEPGPLVLLCGDLHLENFGAYLTDVGRGPVRDQ